jgi:tetratricopeptide (TPR) repeat protein
MNPESFSGSAQATSVETAATRKSTRLESTAFYILLATVVLAPLAFLPTPYIVLDAVKTVLIAIGTLISAILYGVVAYKERSITLPPRSVTWTSALAGLSVIISSFTSVHLGKSFFGQGFELTTASFTLILLLAALVIFTAVYRKVERVPIMYLAMAVPFIILAILHGARLLAGPSFISLGILSGVTSTLVGTWYDLATYALVIALIVIPALMFLPLTRRVKIIYWILLVVSFISAYIINSVLVWTLGTVALLALTIAASITRPRPAAGSFAGFLKHIAWLPLILFIVAGIFSLWGTPLAKPVIEKYNASYSTLTLPWQLTLDVNSDALKNSPLFGIGPNHFGQAYIAYKPAVINTTYAWSAEFNFAFSLLATFVATQGIVGALTWVLLLVFLGILAVRGLRRLPSESHARFAIVSSSFTAFFLWLISAFTVPSHVIVFYTYVATAIAVASIVKYGIVTPFTIAPRIGLRSRGVLSIVTVVLVIAGVLWGVVYVKDSIAIAYFGSGVKSLTSANDPSAADAAFSTAYSLNTSDVYLQARAEAGLAQADKLVSTIKSDMPASTSQQILSSTFDVVNKSVKYSQAAIAYDPTNYYNYASEARVSEFAAKIRMDKAYENAVNSYTEAIRRNQLNPTLYLNLAQLQASQNKLDDALKTLGAALQVKNDYLDAIFLLSQVTAAQGNLKDAIIAAQVATQLNPRNSVLFFQLGLLQYNNKDYVSAAKALEAAIKIQPDYANAQYFLGLSYTRLNDITNAIVQFTNLAKSNPDNQEVAFILKNLQEGKSPFADAKPPVTPAPEKRSTLPVKEKKK